MAIVGIAHIPDTHLGYTRYAKLCPETGRSRHHAGEDPIAVPAWLERKGGPKILVSVPLHKAPGSQRGCKRRRRKHVLSHAGTPGLFRRKGDLMAGLPTCLRRFAEQPRVPRRGIGAGFGPAF